MNFAPHLDWIDTQHQRMVQLVERWAAVNSGSYNLTGLERLCAILQQDFAVLGGEAEILNCNPLEIVNSQGEIEYIPLGKALRIRKRPDAPLRVFLGGHMDTVFAADHPFQKLKYLDDNTLNGPGVADLKGGLAVMLVALEALEQSKWAQEQQIGWEILINPDEEIGSQGSLHLLEQSAKRNHLGLIYEPALADGTLAGARKGSGNFSVVVRGRSAHAGREFAKGRNAIVACAEYTQKLFALNGKREGVTINPGRVEGGGALNAVPDLAIMRFNVRLPDAAAQQWVEQQLLELDRQFAGRDGISVGRYGKFTRPAKILDDRNLALFTAVKESGATLGLDISWQATGGCCDGNNMAAFGLPNVDTLGVRGGKIHSADEFLLLDSLTERAKLSALLLLRLASGEIGW